MVQLMGNGRSLAGSLLLEHCDYLAGVPASRAAGGGQLSSCSAHSEYGYFFRASCDLDPVGRALYIELRQRYNGVNNGMIGLGCREAADALNVGRNVANRAFSTLKEHGFISVGRPSTFNQKRMQTEWRLTEVRDDRTGHEPTKDFTRWPAEIQNAVPLVGRIVTPAGHKTTIEPTNDPYSPMGGTVVDVSPRPQSHGRDTSRSATTGGVANGTR